MAGEGKSSMIGMKRDWSDVENTFTTVLLLKTKKTNFCGIYNDTCLLAIAFITIPSSQRKEERDGQTAPGRPRIKFYIIFTCI